MLLVISMMTCMLAWGQGQNRGQVAITATPERICQGESATLHAFYYAPDPITFDFEDGMQGWTTIDADGHGQAWSYYDYNAHSGSHCMRAAYNSSYSHNDYLISPQITLGVGTVSFYARRYTASGSYQYDTFRVYLSTSGNSSASDFTVELTNGNVTPNTTYTKYEYDLSPYQGQGYIAIVYTAAANQYYLFVDDVTFYEDGSSSSGENTYDFENGSLQGWTTIDADGDGYNWTANNYFGGHNGSEGLVFSQSYYSSYYDQFPLSPDNYLVSPFKVPVQQGAYIRFWACAQDAAYPSEHFGVAISTGSNINAAAFTTIQEWTMTAKDWGQPTSVTRSGNRTQGTWHQYNVDLSAYAGQNIWVALRHFNCSDMFYLDVDDITIYEGSDDPGGGGDDNITYHWEPGNLDGQNITVWPTETTTYTVTATDGNGTVIGVAQQTVVVEPFPVVSITTSTGETSICEDDIITLYASVSGTDYIMPGDILCTDESIVHPSDWPNGKTAKAIVFYVDATGQHGWAIDLIEVPSVKWSTENKDIPGLQSKANFFEAITDLDGYSNTQKIRSFNNDPLKYPAAWAVDFDQGWYLPSIGQLNILFGAYFAVNAGLEAVGGTTIYVGDLWSSNTNATDKAWMIRISNGYVGTDPKKSPKKVRAVIDF